jgi:hypothetical protein
MTLIHTNPNQSTEQADGRSAELAPDRDGAQGQRIAVAGQAADRPAPREGWELLHGRRSLWYYRRSR